MGLTRYGIREWGGATVVALVLSAAWCFFFPEWWYWGLIAVWLVWLVVAGFFRDPIRRVPNHLRSTIMLSPADGTVSAVERYESHEATADGPAVCVRLFLSVLNVHINRSPGEAVVVGKIYRPGKFLDARTAESAKINESNLIIMERERGDGVRERFGVRQVSGKIARRIVDGTREGQAFKRGERFGMIKFGSTTELILPRPDDVEVFVKVGDKVRGGLTPIAEIRDCQ